MRIFHLPGNPLAALVSGLLFTVPLLNRLAGRRSEARPLLARSGASIAHRRGRTKVFSAKMVESIDGEIPPSSSPAMGVQPV